MKRPKRIGIKDIFLNKEWEFISIIDSDKRYRIEAKRPPVKGELNHFIGYASREYTQTLASDYRNGIMLLLRSLEN